MTARPILKQLDSTPAVIQALRNAVGNDAVRVGQEIDRRHHTDWTGMDPNPPLALLLPRSTDEVSTMLRICHAHRQAIVPQGGLTGLVGGAHPGQGDIALSLQRMQAIEDIDQAGCMTVQAGAILASVQDAATERGYTFGLDIGARGSCTIGGNLATNAGGVRVIRYGMMRHLTLGLEVVLADGTVLSSMNRMIKNNSGYDLKDLFIGSEGTLGVITRAILRLHPRPRSHHCAFLGLPSTQASLDVLHKAQAALSGSLSAFEVMWPAFHDFVIRLPGVRSPLATRHAMYVLMETQGDDDAAEAARLESLLESLLEDGLIHDAALACSDADIHDFWHLRDAVAEFPLHLPYRSTFDVSFPLHCMQQAVQQIQTQVQDRWPDATQLVFGHMGDNNLHIVLDIPGTQGRHASALEAIVYDTVARMQGAVSAEHGIGRKKRQYLHLTRSQQEIDVMQRLKTALDPHGILNPGKVI